MESNLRQQLLDPGKGASSEDTPDARRVTVVPRASYSTPKSEPSFRAESSDSLSTAGFIPFSGYWTYILGLSRSTFATRYSVSAISFEELCDSQRTKSAVSKRLKRMLSDQTMGGSRATLTVPESPKPCAPVSEAEPPKLILPRSTPEENQDVYGAASSPSDDYLRVSQQTLETSPTRLNSLPFSQHNLRAAEFMAEDIQGLAQYRFLDRNAAFEQSNGHINFFRGVCKGTEKAIQKLYFTDWYHTFLNLRLRYQLLCFVLIYLSLWTIYAALIYAVRENCDLQMTSFLDAYYLSVETLETIGYGVPDQYFNQCWEMAVLLSLEAMITTILNAFLIGVIFSRLARPQSRASTIVFSSKALVQYNEDGAPHLVFRIADLRRHQLIEGHIRLYCILHNNDSNTQSFQRSGMNIYPMRLNQPDDELGGMLLLTTPQFVVHRIDPWSPLSPYFRPMELRPFSSRKTLKRSPNFSLQTNCAGSIPQRLSDADTGNRVAFMCEVCGQEFSSFKSLKRHTEHEKEEHAGYTPVEPPEPTDDQLNEHWMARSFEVFCVCEGIEPFTSSTIQSRHSYLTSTDVLFGHSFLPCVRVQPSGICLFDVSRFHKTVAAQPGVEPPVPMSRTPQPNSHSRKWTFNSLMDTGAAELVILESETPAEARGFPKRSNSFM
eukprot:GEMP01012494.1.p1 GENE.GEMP01012494.1~~GEMP01012494.1.p1  ORF type:complete len:663 (+),score=99.94 GEMP01012494.1:79-2067(+)